MNLWRPNYIILGSPFNQNIGRSNSRQKKIVLSLTWIYFATLHDGLFTDTVTKLLTFLFKNASFGDEFHQQIIGLVRLSLS